MRTILIIIVVGVGVFCCAFAGDWSSLSGPKMASGSEGMGWWAQRVGQQHGPSCPSDAFEQQLSWWPRIVGLLCGQSSASRSNLVQPLPSGLEQCWTLLMTLSECPWSVFSGLRVSDFPAPARCTEVFWGFGRLTSARGGLPIEAGAAGGWCGCLAAQHMQELWCLEPCLAAWSSGDAWGRWCGSGVV